MIISIALAARDEADLASGHKRKKAGDLITIKPYPWQWGTNEIKEYLIININLGQKITDYAIAAKLEVPHFIDGRRWWSEAGNEKVVAKRRYKILFTDLENLAQSKGISIDWGRVADLNDPYQPLDGTIFMVTELLTIAWDKVLIRKFKDIDWAEIKAG